MLVSRRGCLWIAAQFQSQHLPGLQWCQNSDRCILRWLCSSVRTPGSSCLAQERSRFSSRGYCLPHSLVGPVLSPPGSAHCLPLPAPQKHSQPISVVGAPVSCLLNAEADPQLAPAQHLCALLATVHLWHLEPVVRLQDWAINRLLRIKENVLCCVKFFSEETFFEYSIKVQLCFAIQELLILLSKVGLLQEWNKAHLFLKSCVLIVFQSSQAYAITVQADLKYIVQFSSFSAWFSRCCNLSFFVSFLFLRIETYCHNRSSPVGAFAVPIFWNLYLCCYTKVCDFS